MASGKAIPTGRGIGLIILPGSRQRVRDKSMTSGRVYKLLTPADWAQAQAVGHAEVAVDRADGYVHLSTAAQLPGTAARHFAGIDRIRLLEFEADDLTDLRWEPAREGALFPHLYGRLDIASAIASFWVSHDQNGLTRIVEETG